MGRHDHGLADIRAAFETHEASITAASHDLACALPRCGEGGDPAAADRALAALDALQGQTRTVRQGLTRVENALRDVPAARAGALGYTRDAKRWFRASLHALRARARTWSVVRGAVLRAMDPKPARLYPPAVRRHSRNWALSHASEAVFVELHRVANPADQSAAAVSHGCFADIVLPPAEFLLHLHAATRILRAQGREPARFLDVGCGGGVKVLLAAEFVARADGLEYDPGYASAARDLFAQTNARTCACIDGDALQFDNYAAYDIIYFYQPMHDTAGLFDLERRILEFARPGTVIIAPYSGFVRRRHALACQPVEQAVHIAGVTAEEADTIIRRAKMVGLANPRAGAPVSPITAVWEPLIDALRDRGFEPL